MSFTRLFQGPSAGSDSNVDRLFFTKADPQPFRHPLLAHLQHSLYAQLDGGDRTLSGKHSLGGGALDYYYPSTPHRHSHSWVGGGKSKHHKSNSTALSALTLLAFLFFLNLLQNCLREQMETMNPTVMVMTAGAARGERLEKSTEQLQSEPVEEDEAVVGGAYSDETEPLFPEGRVQTPQPMNVSLSPSPLPPLLKGVDYQFHKLKLRDEESNVASTTERIRFQRISSASYSSHEATSPRNVLFRTRF